MTEIVGPSSLLIMYGARCLIQEERFDMAYIRITLLCRNLTSYQLIAWSAIADLACSLSHCFLVWQLFFFLLLYLVFTKSGLKTPPCFTHSLRL